MFAGVHDDAGAFDSVAAEDGGFGLLALLVGEAAELVVQLAGEVGHADEFSARVVSADAELFHGALRVGGWIGELHQRGIELCAGFGADDAVLGEEAENADGLLQIHAERIRHDAAVVERFAEVRHVANGLVCAGGERVGGGRGVLAGQVEHGERLAHVFGGVSDVHLSCGGEVEGCGQAAGEDVADTHAGLGQIVDRTGALARSVDGARTGLQCGLA